MPTFTVSDARFQTGNHPVAILAPRPDLDMDAQQYDGRYRARSRLLQANCNDYQATCRHWHVHSVFCTMLIEEMHHQHKSRSNISQLQVLVMKYHQAVAANLNRGTDPYPDALNVLQTWQWPK